MSGRDWLDSKPDLFGLQNAAAALPPRSTVARDVSAERQRTQEWITRCLASCDCPAEESLAIRDAYLKERG